MYRLQTTQRSPCRNGRSGAAGAGEVRAERNVRTAVSRAWQVNPELLRAVAGYPLDAAPTASEFIEMLASYIQSLHKGRLEALPELTDEAV